MTHAFPYEPLIATTPDWPTPGVMFRDISPLLAQRFPETIDALASILTSPLRGEVVRSSAPEGVPNRDAPHPNPLPVYGERELSGIDAFAGVDARGFIFAAALAQKFGKNLVMIRKGGKLPPPSLRETCTLEYGTATFEMKPAVPIEQSCHPRASGDPENAMNWIPVSAGMTSSMTATRPPRIIILDDVLATGGTLRAAADLCTRAGYDVVALATLINLAFLNDFTWNGLKVRAVVTYE